MTFIEEIIENKYKQSHIIEEIFAIYVEEWHNSDTDKEIYDYLGITREEYGKIVENPNNIKDIIRRYL